jgi:hypothetical protein
VKSLLFGGDGQRFGSDPLSDPSTAYLGSNINEGSLSDLSYLHGLLPYPLERPLDLISPPWASFNEPPRRSVEVFDLGYLHGLLPPLSGRPLLYTPGGLISLPTWPHSVEVPVPNAVPYAVTTSADSYSPDFESHTMRYQTLCSYLFTFGRSI